MNKYAKIVQKTINCEVSNESDDIEIERDNLIAQSQAPVQIPAPFVHWLINFIH